MRLSTVNDDLNWNRGAIVNYYSFQPYGFGTSGPDNNGNLLVQQHWIPNDDAISGSSFMQQNYGYDALNRLNLLGEFPNGGAQTGGQSFDYDRYGNRTINPSSWGVGINNKQFTVNTVNNRLGVPSGQTGTMTYDNAGNLTTDTYSGAGVTRAYDAENRMTSETQANSYVAGTYTYNADGQRVRRKVNGVETWQVYGMDGELLAEYGASAAAGSPQKEYGYRNGQLLITADVTTGPPVPTFSDDFNDNSLDTAKWSVVDPNSPAVVSETGQRLQITLPPNTAAYNGIYSNSTFDLTGKSVQVEVAQTVSQAGWCENFIQVALDANNYYLIDVGAGSMVFRSMTGGVNNQTVISYDQSAFPYWRIRHDQAANTINLETSSNGTAWTTRKTVTAGFSLTALRFYLYAGAWGTGNGSPGAAKYDNFQLVGNTPSTVVNLQWLVTDQLGTPRMVFDKTGALATVKRHDYLPFGEELGANVGGRTPQQGYTGDIVRQKFTQKERDNETGLDYFLARYYSSTQGRFTSVDPQNIIFDKNQGRNGDERARILQSYIVQPQNWNRYAYTRNNPLAYTDPNGRCSAPSGLSKGNVGICIEAFIASPHIKGIGLGDNRGFAPNDPSKTSRIELSGTISRSAFAWNTDLHGTAGRSRVLIESVGFQGTIEVKGNQTVDKDGNLHLHVQMTGTSGLSGLPGAPEGHIQVNVNLMITPDGKVGIEGGDRTAYPSVGIYSYNMGADGKPAVTTLGEGRETTPAGLTQPLVPIQPVPPTCNCPEPNDEERRRNN